MKKANEAAFPHHVLFQGQDIRDAERVQGLSKRELFAVMAMQGTLANSAHNFVPEDRSVFPGLAEVCVRFADALLAELEEKDSE